MSRAKLLSSTHNPVGLTTIGVAIMDPTIKRVERDLTDLQRSLNTKRCYTQILTRLQRHYGCPLDELGPELHRRHKKISSPATNRSA